MQYISAMTTPGGGRQDIPNRLKRHFFVFAMVQPSVLAINEIYGQMLRGRFADNTNKNFRQILRFMPSISVQLWDWMRQKMLPTPTKFHYSFNLRELSRIFQGILRTPRESVPDTHTLFRLWRHECERVFADKLTTIEDKFNFQDLKITEGVGRQFAVSMFALDVLPANPE